MAHWVRRKQVQDLRREEMNFMARRVLHGMSKSRGTDPGSSPVRAFNVERRA
jgi:hypothetical protein